MARALIVGGPLDGELTEDGVKPDDDYVPNEIYAGQHIWLWRGLFMRDAIMALASVYNAVGGAKVCAKNPFGHAATRIRITGAMAESALGRLLEHTPQLPEILR